MTHLDMFSWCLTVLVLDLALSMDIVLAPTSETMGLLLTLVDMMTEDEDTGVDIVDIVERDVFLCLQLLLLLTPLLSVSGESLVSEAEILNTSSSLTLSSLTVEASPPRLTIIMRSVMKTQWNIINYHMIHWKIEKLSCLFLRSLLATKFIRVQGIKRLL